MATSFTNTPIAHTSDATFRTWGSELSGMLGNVGTTSGCLTQTSDTGQINWTTVTRPGTNTAAGYEIWQLTDSLGVSSPVYIKLEYGTGVVAAAPLIWVTVGTGTNGAGTLTGSVSTRAIAGGNNTPTSTVTDYQSWVCCVDGHIGVAFKVGFSASGNVTAGCFVVERFCDADATLRSDGVQVYVTSGGTAPTATSLNLVTGTQYGTITSNKAYCMVVNGVTSTASGSDFSAFKHYGAYPQIHALNGVCTVLRTELALGAEAPMTLNGATPHNYVSLGGPNINQGVTSASVSGTGDHAFCMLWE